MDVVKNKAVNKIIPYIKAIENNYLSAPLSLHIFLTDSCVNKCNMCDHWKTENKNNLSIEKVKSIWNEMNYNGGESICLTGGDPVLHPNFNEILQLDRKFDLGVISTGNFKKDFDYDYLRGLAWFRFSIDSLNPSVYKEIRGLDNLNETIIPNVLKSKEYLDKIGINFTIQKNNSKEVLDIIEFCISNNIYRLIVYPMHGDENLSMGIKESNLVFDQLSKAIELGYHKSIPENNIEFLYETLLKSSNSNINFRKVTQSHMPCMINKIHLTIGTDGNVFPCCFVADDTDAYGERKMWVEYKQNSNTIELGNKKIINSLGNINEKSIIGIWKENYYNSFGCNKCDRCFSRYQPIIKTYWENIGKKVFI